jgi:microcystin-dependent protein
MAYNQDFPANSDYLVTAPTEIRENFRALKEDKIVAADSANTADSAVKLANARTISLTGDAAGSAAFDGSADISIIVDVTSADSAATCTGNAATSTKLETAHTINDVAFDGTADITITQVNGKDIATVDQIPDTSESVPIGGIIIWSGSDIPAKWALCNGLNGTPDLRGKFVLGYNDTYAIGQAGGEEKHKLTIEEMPSHNHGQGAKAGSYQYGAVTSYGDDDPVILSATLNTGGDQPHNNMPPYYALAYIMRII